MPPRPAGVFLLLAEKYFCCMSLRRVSIDEFLPAPLLIDVRAPQEFAHAHIPGAHSLPLFSDEERKTIGTAYKRESREKAIKLGLEYFGPKMRGMVEAVEKLLRKSACGQKVHVYCWRGGMRSGAVSWLLDLYGFDVTVLSGGYKAFRRQVLLQLELPYRLHILGGYTGSGKTAVLEGLQAAGAPVLDLEAIACHRGSAFGKTGKRQPSQEMFENEMARVLQAFAFTGGKFTADHTPIWVEDESQRIGTVNIPQPFWKTMRQAPVYFLEVPFEKRLDYIVSGYGGADREKLIECTLRISKRLGGLEAKNTVLHLQEGKIREAFSILLQYYDKLYRKGLHNREDLSALLHMIPCETTGLHNMQALQYQSV